MSRCSGLVAGRSGGGRGNQLQSPKRWGEVVGPWPMLGQAQEHFAPPRVVRAAQWSSHNAKQFNRTLAIELDPTTGSNTRTNHDRAAGLGPAPRALQHPDDATPHSAENLRSATVTNLTADASICS